MKSLIKSIWSRTKKESEVRQLDHPRSLQIGDLLQMSNSYGLPECLRAQVFKVGGLGTCQFQHSFSTTFSLRGEKDDGIELTIEKDSGRERAAFSFTAGEDLVEKIFDLDDFSKIFEGKSTTLFAKDISIVDGFIAEEYSQTVLAERGYYYEGQDFRGLQSSSIEGEGEPFDYFCLVSKRGTHAVEIEVYEGGETEVCLTLYRDTTDIKELWPASGQ